MADHLRADPSAVDVLFVDHTARMGGGEVALVRLVAAMDPKRYRPTVLLLANGPLRAELAAVGVEAAVVPLDDALGNVRKEALGAMGLAAPRQLWKSLRFVLRLARFIRRSRAAIVHTNSLKADLLAGLAARLARVPLVWHVRDRIADDYLPPAAATAFRLGAAAIPNYVIANSRATLATLGRLASAGPGRACVVYDSVAVEPLPPPLPTDPGRSPVVGLVGRLTEWKGQHVFLDAAALVRRQFPRAQFQLVGAALFGEEAYQRRLLERAAEADLAGSIQFLGFCTDVPQRVAAMDVLAHASTTGEPFGQVVIEGMAAGKPVVATAGGGIPEIITDGDSGLLVPMGDAPALAAAIIRLLGDPALRARLGERGRARVIEAFTPDITARGVEAVYDRMLERTPAASTERR